MINKELTYRKFLEDSLDQGSYATDDVIAFVMPLFREVLGFHEASLVAPFEKEEALFITDNRLDIDESFARAPALNLKAVQALSEKFKIDHFEVVGKLKLDTDVSAGSAKITDLQVHLKISEPLVYPAYVPGITCYEILLGHHDEHTDIFCLGLVLGSIAMGLDLYDEEDLKVFASARSNPAHYNERIHPTIAMLIMEMTELDRSKRAQDLYDIIHRLEHYRDFDPEKQTDLSQVPGWVNKTLTDRSQFILNKLRNRLFDNSRRNRLLYYKPNLRFVNLTVSSVPMVLHYQSIRPDLLFTWNEEISAKVKGMKELVLNKYLRFEDHLYLPSSLDKIRVEAQRDVQEFGFSQLKLVASFLNWHNLKEDKNERIQSPLLLIPVELKRNKKLKEDHYVMKVLDSSAEVNPVLANYMRELYGIKLPDLVDLDEMSMQQFYELLKVQVEGASQGISLNYIDKPRIKLVHSVAKQTVNNYRKRLKRSGSELFSYKNIPYNYQQENYRPLGLEIFRQRIQLQASHLEFLVNEDIRSSHQLTGNPTAKERQLFHLAESESNPYSWEFDACNMVLGNFNYKKMSLVRDYNHVIDERVQNTVFEQLFSSLPKDDREQHTNLNQPVEWSHVVSADPTQTRAILQSRKGESYIIQGPPGTGKSQTITNLIADFVARGKRILFVCEKRAALDIVYHRLKQQSLDELCCYIHDSQGDKRDFIRNLKQTYEDFRKTHLEHDRLTRQKSELLKKLDVHLELLKLFHVQSDQMDEKAGTSARKLVERVILLKQHLLQLTPAQEEQFPHYQAWLDFGTAIKELSQALDNSGADNAFAGHAFSMLNDAVFTHDNPYSFLNGLLEKSQPLLTKLMAGLKNAGLPSELIPDVGALHLLLQDAALLQPLVASGNLSLLHGEKEAAVFDAALQDWDQLKEKLEQSKEKNKYWRVRFSEPDTLTALELCQKYEGSFLSFLNGTWRKLKRQLNESYDFSGHQVRPSRVTILTNLLNEYAALHALNKRQQELQQHYRSNDIERTRSVIAEIRSRKGNKNMDFLLSKNDAGELVSIICGLKDVYYELEENLVQLLVNYRGQDLQVLLDTLENISANTGVLKELLPSLRTFSQLPGGLKNALRNFPLDPESAEVTMARRSLEYIYNKNRAFAGIDMPAIEKATREIKVLYKMLLRLNADLTRASIRSRFKQHLELTQIAVSQLSLEQRKFKKDYNEGRKILENEFSKSMRYKSIRELATKESGLVLKDLKPVWLMSPLSVSDSLPLDTGFFDVIIFDEASQITLEEGIPALYRAPQTIIVGDDKQMPPTNFFTARAEDPDDLEALRDGDDDELLSNDADSLLVQGARKLPSVMLGWHYRSRYETLISFSNHAFYEAGLLTIPDKTIHHTEKKAIEVHRPEDARENANCLYDRSISFHFHSQSIYEKRINLDEAGYIAHLVRELLVRKVKESIGIVAFSQEQQHTIEDALTRLAADDKAFEQALEEAYARTEDDQFVGLFVKNLENVQGDERDIIIMSVCYGFDSRKKMIMNFGPINKKGGEKRLNVIFSRARKHMAVISSIRHYNITNEYNEGAAYFRNFLHYAELVSSGHMGMARTILDGLVLKKERQSHTHNGLAAAAIIRHELEQRGYLVTEQVGQSDFKCSLAVKHKPDDEEYTLGILLDDDSHYRNPNLAEQYFQRPAILESFGWKVMFVSLKDWLEHPDHVLEQIIRRLKDPPPSDPTITLPEIEGPPPPVKNENPSPVNEPVRETGTYAHLQFKRLIFSEGSSNKFWEVAVDDVKLIVRFGRIGTKGQLQVKSFSNAEVARQEMEKLIREKLAKGYKAS